MPIAKCPDCVSAVVLLGFVLRSAWQRVKVIKETGGAEEIDEILLVNEKTPRAGEASSICSVTKNGVVIPSTLILCVLRIIVNNKRNLFLQLRIEHHLSHLATTYPLRRAGATVGAHQPIGSSKHNGCGSCTTVAFVKPSGLAHQARCQKLALRLGIQQTVYRANPSVNNLGSDLRLKLCLHCGNPGFDIFEG